jgi:hypothetical protein
MKILSSRYENQNTSGWFINRTMPPQQGFCPVQYRNQNTPGWSMAAQRPLDEGSVQYVWELKYLRTVYKPHIAPLWGFCSVSMGIKNLRTVYKPHIAPLWGFCPVQYRNQYTPGQPKSRTAHPKWGFCPVSVGNKIPQVDL